uniref:Uncharacterized protein n=1 Tax=Avena sativa TaxID=4498 RepID=A0ACD6AA51_AVESA
MRIRRCASRVLGSSASAPALPRFELPPPPPPPAHAGSVAASATSCSSSLEPCKLSLSPWDLMDQLHPSDPQAEKIFLETYFVAVAWRASWLFQSSMPAACSIKEEEQQEEDTAVDVVDGVIFELHVCGKNAARKKNEMKPNMNKVKIKAEESDATTAGGQTPPVWRCKRNGGKTWFCRRPASRPNSFCSYHSDQKPKRKRDTGVGEGFYYYAGFGARSKRHRVSGSGSDAVPEPPPPAGQEEEAAVEEEKHIDFTAGQAEADNGAEHQPVPPASVVDRTAGIAGWDEEESSDDGAVKTRDTKRKSPLKKRWRKPVKARSLKSLM